MYRFGHEFQAPPGLITALRAAALQQKQQWRNMDMNTLKTIQKLCRLGKALCRAAFVLAVIGFSAAPPG